MKKNIILSLLLSFPFLVYSQSSLEFNLGAGFTAIDIEGLVEKDEISGAVALDWGQASYGLSAQYFMEPKGNVSFGAELMYQYLYWYNVRVPYGIQPITREYSVDAIKISPIARFGAWNSLSFDIGPTINLSDETDIGLMMSGNYNIAISNNMEIPIKFRVDVISKAVIAIPISFSGGIRISLD